jgi:hypothetical protein
MVLALARCVSVHGVGDTPRDSRLGWRSGRIASSGTVTVPTGAAISDK